MRPEITDFIERQRGGRTKTGEEEKMNYEMTENIGLISIVWCTVKRWPVCTESLEEPASSLTA